MAEKQKGFAPAAGWLLIGASLGAVLFMTHHPTLGSSGYESVIAEAQAEAMINRIVHGVMIVFTLAFYVGLRAHGDLIGRTHITTRCADAALALATSTMIGAALLSGFVASELAFRFDPASTADAEMYRTQLRLTGAGNQALAKTGTVAYGAAIFLYAIRMLTMPSPARITGALGVLIGAGVAAAILGGFIRLGVFGMGLIVAAMGVWFIAVGVRLIMPRTGTD